MVISLRDLGIYKQTIDLRKIAQKTYLVVETELIGLQKLAYSALFHCTQKELVEHLAISDLECCLGRLTVCRLAELLIPVGN